MNLTRHAKTRSQQRRIPQLLIDLLDQFGAEETATSGGRIRYFDKAARRKVRAYSGPIAKSLEEFMDVYMVMDGSTIITIGYRLAHIQRH